MTVGILANLLKPQVGEVLQSLVQWLSDRKVEVCVLSDLFERLEIPTEGVHRVTEKEFAARSDLFVVMGGDGTLLASARRLGPAQKPILGINLGGLGFLTDVALDELFFRLEAVLSGHYMLERRMMLETVVQSPGRQRRGIALNDVVLARGGIPRMVRIRVEINGDYFATYFADGLIVSSPTGSTAYALAAGGPIVYPTLESLLITPICPHTLGVRPTLFPPTSRIRMKLESTEREASVSLDGQEMWPVDSESRIDVFRGPDIHLVKFEDHRYFDILRAKLNWGFPT